MRPSDQKLHDALAAAGLPAMAKRAATGEWNDYFGTHDLPQHALIAELRERQASGLPELAAKVETVITRVIAGDFDAGKDESDEWSKSPEGAQVFRELLAADPPVEATDPRTLGGGMTGSTDPFAEGEVVIDASKAIMMDNMQIAKVDGGARGQEAFALVVTGRLNRSTDRATVVIMCPLDGMAAFITQCHGAAERTGPDVLKRLHQLCEERWGEMPHRP